MTEDDDLRDVIGDAVIDVEPTDRLGAIRQRTRKPARRRWYAVGGASVLVAAAAVTGFAVVGRDSAPRASDPAGPSTPSSTQTHTYTEIATPEAVAVYYVGPGSDGPDAPPSVLYRYFDHDATPLELLMRTPADPDYRTLWPAGSLASYDVVDGEIRVQVNDGPVNDDLARQQLIYTLQAAVGQRLPVSLGDADGRSLPIRPIEMAPQLDVLNHMSISDPAEATSYAGSFTARGVSNGFEASVACWLYVGHDGGAYGPYVTTASGYQGERLYPWEMEVDLADVPAGDYTFSCTTDDPTGGSQGYGAATDTRSITVE